MIYFCEMGYNIRSFIRLSVYHPRSGYHSDSYITRFRRERISLKKPSTNVDGFFMVGVAGFEPAASWTRTMRDTKLRHTPIANTL